VAVRDPLLAGRDGRLLVGSQALSFGAHGISTVALPWLVLDAHDSTVGAGLVATFGWLPYVAFGLAAGVVGDRIPPRRVMALTHALQALVALAVPLWTIAGTPPVALVFAAAFAIGAGRVFSDAAVFGVIPEVAGRERMTHAQATLGAAWSAGLLAGPAVGGVLVAAVGPARSLAVEAALLAAAAVVIRLLRAGAAAPPGAAGRAREVVRGGLATIFGDPLLRRLTLFGASWVFAAAGAYGLSVPLLRGEIGLSSGEAGAVLAAGGAAGIVAAPIVGRLAVRMEGVRIVTGFLPLVAGSIAVCGLAPGLGLALPGFFVFYLADSIVTAAYIGERQRRAPPALQATVGISGRMIVMLALTTGSACASGLAGSVSIRWLYVGVAAVVMAIAVLAGPRVTRAATETGAGSSASRRRATERGSSLS
jgi:MFS family permease